MAKISLDDATLAQLRSYAADILNLEVKATANKPMLVGTIRTVTGLDHIEVPDAETPALQKGHAPRAADAETTAKTRVRVLIQQEEGGPDPVFISVNGEAISVRRGEEVEISAAHFEALKNAVRAIPITDRNGSLVGTKMAPTFPYQLIA